MSALVLDAVSKRYRGGVQALTDVSVEIEDGAEVAIVGPSGSGKSTLLHIMGALDSPTEGSVWVAGRELSSLSDRALSRFRGRFLGFVFQQANLLPHLTALENVMIGMQYAGFTSAGRTRTAQSALERVGLVHRMGHRPAALSGGEQQRVGIARAVVGRPALVLADEPTGALDQETGGQIVALLHELHAEGTTVALITHDPAVAGSFARRLELRDGRMTGQVSW